MWVAKHASGFCGVGRMMKIWGFWQEDTCPCCLLGKVETVGHLLHCPVAWMQKVFSKGVQEIQEWMQRSTCLAIADVLGWFLAAQGGQTWVGEEVPPCLMEAAVEQDRIAGTGPFRASSPRGGNTCSTNGCWRGGVSNLPNGGWPISLLNS